jgi:predicted dehydrogenase
MAKLRLGVIGAGSWTVSSHLPNLIRHADEVEFVIVNRRNP